MADVNFDNVEHIWAFSMPPANVQPDVDPDKFDCAELTQWATARGDVPEDDWITDVTDQSVEVLGQSAETLDITHVGFPRGEYGA